MEQMTHRGGARPRPRGRVTPYDEVVAEAEHEQARCSWESRMSRAWWRSASESRLLDSRYPRSSKPDGPRNALPRSRSGRGPGFCWGWESFSAGSTFMVHKNGFPRLSSPAG